MQHKEQELTLPQVDPNDKYAAICMFVCNLQSITNTNIDTSVATRLSCDNMSNFIDQNFGEVKTHSARMFLP